MFLCPCCPGASCRRQPRGAVKRCAAAWPAQGSSTGLPHLVCKVSRHIVRQRGRENIKGFIYWNKPYAFFLCSSYVCPCVLRPKDGTTDLQKVADFNQAYQVKKTMCLSTLCFFCLLRCSETTCPLWCHKRRLIPRQVSLPLEGKLHPLGPPCICPLWNMWKAQQNTITSKELKLSFFFFFCRRPSTES